MWGCRASRHFLAATNYPSSTNSRSRKGDDGDDDDHYEKYDANNDE